MQSRKQLLLLKEDHDVPGTWWYVVELDDKPLVSTSIEIRPNED